LVSDRLGQEGSTPLEVVPLSWIPHFEIALFHVIDGLVNSVYFLDGASRDIFFL
jgi:hypothetical protein